MPRPFSLLAHWFTFRRHPAPAGEVPSPQPPTPPPKDLNISFNTARYRSKPLPAPIDDHDEYVNEKVALRFSDVDTSQVQRFSSSTAPSSPPRDIHTLPRRPYVTHVAIPTAPLTPEETARRRLSAQRRREREEEEARREERARRELRKLQREEQERREREEEERRRALLQEHLRQAAARREEKEREEKRIEEERHEQIRQQKLMAHQRRLEYTRELDQWRQEHIQRAISSSSEKQEERRRSAEERRNRIAKLGESLLNNNNTAKAARGWVTIQTPESLAWKRRYYKFDLGRGQMLLYPNHVDTAHPIDIVELDNRTEGLHEWYEGFEELRAIPHSFAIQFVHGRSWFMYADAEEEKDRLLLWLSEAAGIIL
ncbi:hypothetical protein BKA82DRAFT_995470 [Pisolithus tinctorius]|uniref:PH domain-containing protein n=1 Tax=Pisolithus tinctorius Marx 270 TaxID=870435 RepID=A0A0C3PN65_PISTI|nr:hypothetical protein BKA82DRAFT_995470 [Pisolithus tinctorius]KIO10266.1 hypothetical protein M404DRAFT_995470 [Pisolithus tinctorius Marx 270]